MFKLSFVKKEVITIIFTKYILKTLELEDSY